MFNNRYSLACLGVNRFLADSIVVFHFFGFMSSLLNVQNSLTIGQIYRARQNSLVRLLKSH